MCGIAGIFSYSNAPEEACSIAQQMSEAIAYRGPDGSGIWHDDVAVLAHRRLAIIDLNESANQPMSSADGTLEIVFNGEIYNYAELRKSLENCGIYFRTQSDTEVILAAYQHFGAESFAAQLDGMFALALYDRNARRLTLLRDRLGKKPLFYFQHGATLVFASELGALKRHPDFPRELSGQAIFDYLFYDYVPGESETAFVGVHKVPPATQVTLQANAAALSFQRYWSCDYSSKLKINLEDAQSELRRLMRNAVRKRLISDVPCGVFLSGGVDSGIVGRLAAEEADKALSFFTIGFGDSRYDERKLAQISFEALRPHSKVEVAHYEQVVEPRDFEVLERLSEHYGEPYADFSMLPTFMLAKFASAQVKLCLGGDGADEVFAGYERYLMMKYAAYADWVPDGLRRGVSKSLQCLPGDGKRTFAGRLKRAARIAAEQERKRYFALVSQADEAFVRGLCAERLATSGTQAPERWILAAEKAATTLCAQEKYQEIDLHTYLVGDILTKVDIAAMANALEVRSPYLDREVVEFAAALPYRFKQNGHSRKHVLRTAFAPELPEALFSGRKRGFAVPLGSWIRHEWQSCVSERLLEGNLCRNNWCRKKNLEQLLQQHTLRGIDHTELLGALLMLELFLEKNETLH